MPDHWPDLAKADWKDLYPRLLLIAHGRMRRMRWRGRTQDTPPGGPLPEDFVHRAILKALDGSRDFDGRRSLFENLCQIMSSDISNIAQSYENKNVERAHESGIERVPSGDVSQEDEYIRRDETEVFIKYLRSRDMAAALTAEAVLLRGASTQDIGAELGWTAGQVENAKKRVRRLALQYLSEARPAEIQKLLVAHGKK